ncbi:hypothetical protein [Pendulispora albinea]|uniref:Uncharacterized protein n=1 Tax=Pendulispora albinea TaxID=2741071 RepID=A0ABZ2M469_9BACT
MASLRYTRQTRLADVGPSGQARLEGLRVRVTGSSLDARVEALYLAGAGVGTIVEDETMAEVVRGINPGVGVTIAGPRAQTDAGAANGATAGSTSAVSEGDAVEKLGALHGGAAEVAQGAMRALLAMRRGLFDGETGR